MEKPEIQIWYGVEQSFGVPGNPQNWVNIHGRVLHPDHVYNLVYTLNSSKQIPLSMGPSAYRLLSSGDFTIEIDRNSLKTGINHLSVIVKDIQGHTIIKNIKLTYTDGNIWPLPFFINWSEVSHLQQVSRVVDGKWVLESNGVRPLEIGYDRLIAIGDMAWTDYEVTVPITILGFNTDPLCFDLPSMGPGVGLILRWKGHYDWNDIMPRRGYKPLGAIGWYKYGNDKKDGIGEYRLEITRATENKVRKIRDKSEKKLSLGIPYMFKFRVTSRFRDTSIYQLKVWNAKEEEPIQWDLEAEGLEGELESGSLLLLAHHTNAIFGDIRILSTF